MDRSPAFRTATAYRPGVQFRPSVAVQGPVYTSRPLPSVTLTCALGEGAGRSCTASLNGEGKAFISITALSSSVPVLVPLVRPIT